VIDSTVASSPNAEAAHFSIDSGGSGIASGKGRVNQLTCQLVV
jgi:hypothetical protein